jgi:hypothetical protein
MVMVACSGGGFTYKRAMAKRIAHLTADGPFFVREEAWVHLETSVLVFTCTLEKAEKVCPRKSEFI